MRGRFPLASGVRSGRDCPDGTDAQRRNDPLVTRPPPADLAAVFVASGLAPPGNRLVNELVVPLRSKDASNALSPNAHASVTPVVNAVKFPIVPKLVQNIYESRTAPPRTWRCPTPQPSTRSPPYNATAASTRSSPSKPRAG